MFLSSSSHVLSLSLFLFTPLFSFSQTKMLLSGKDEKDVKMLFLGVENPVSIKIKNVDNKRIDLKFEDGIVEKSGNDFIIILKNVDRRAIDDLIVYIDSIEICRYPYVVKNVPDPRISIGNVCNDGPINKNVLLVNGKISAACDKENLQILTKYLPSKIIGFEMTSGNGKYYKASGSDFTQEQITFIKQLKSGQKLYIVNVKWLGPDGAIRKLGTRELKIL